MHDERVIFRVEPITININFILPQQAPTDGVVLGEILERINTMNQALTDAIDALNAEVAEDQGKLASIKTYLEGLPEVVAAAVQSALEAVNADATAAAAQIDAARSAMSDSTDDALAAINANPAPGEPPVATTPPTGDVTNADGSVTHADGSVTPAP